MRTQEIWSVPFDLTCMTGFHESRQSPPGMDIMLTFIICSVHSVFFLAYGVLRSRAPPWPSSDTVLVLNVAITTGSMHNICGPCREHKEVRIPIVYVYAGCSIRHVQVWHNYKSAKSSSSLQPFCQHHVGGKNIRPLYALSRDHHALSTWSLGQLHDFRHQPGLHKNGLAFVPV